MNDRHCEAAKRLAEAIVSLDYAKISPQSDKPKLICCREKTFIIENNKDTGVSDREAIDLSDRLDPGTLAQNSRYV